MPNIKLDTALTDAKQVGERLRKARNAQERTQGEVADTANVSRSALVHYERGDAVPGGLELVKLAQTLKVTPNYLLSGSEAFFRSQNLDVSLAHPETIAPRIAICVAILDREVSESISALLMSLVKAKLTKRQFEGFLKAIDMVEETATQMKPEIENAAEKHLEGMFGKKLAVKQKSKTKS